MFNVTCFDSYGNAVKALTQWDLNTAIKIKWDIFPIETFKSAEFHFCNKNSAEALVVEGVWLDDSVEIPIPNILLQEPLPITLYIYDYKGSHPQHSYGKTITSVDIPLRPRVKPDGYIYQETEIITYKSLIDDALQEAKASGDFDGAPGEKGEKGDKGDKGDMYPIVQEINEESSETDVASARAIYNLTGDIKAAIDEVIALQELYISDSVKTITFVIDGNSYTCPEGMTWAELENYNGGEIWNAESLSISAYAPYFLQKNGVEVTTIDPIALSTRNTYISDVIRDVSENISYTV